MKRCMILLPLLLALLLAACGGKAQTPVVVEPTTTKIPTSTATIANTLGVAVPTATEAFEAEAVIESAQIVPGSAPSECTVVSSLPEPPQEYIALFSPTEYDWVYGPDTAAVTIIEYSDFQ